MLFLAAEKRAGDERARHVMEQLDYVCPEGLDCAFLNSCPAAGVVPCPDGWYCGTYNGHAHESLLDKLYFSHHGAQPTVGTYYDGSLFQTFPIRWWQSPCPLGFVCPTSTQLLPCPAGFWCPDGCVTPLKCNTLSYCPDGSSYHISLLGPLLAVVVTLVIVLASIWLNIEQARAEYECRSIQPTGDARRGPQSNAECDPDCSGCYACTAEAGIEHSPDDEVDGHCSEKGESKPIIFSDITVRVSSHVVLQVASLSLPPSRLIGLMGPSGCGKSTLLHSLLTLQRQEDRLQHMHGSVAMVPQDDIVDRALTAREALLFRARACHSDTYVSSSSDMSAARAVAIVLRELNLEHIADVCIGGATEDGSGNSGAGSSSSNASRISGGQLKRVSIGLDLIQSARALSNEDSPNGAPDGTKTVSARARTPTMLLLDEPTSGLDATGSWSLARTLHALSRRGITVLAALHQPRREVWEALDHVVLMAPHWEMQGQGQNAGSASRFAERGPGSVVYCGPRALAVEYFLALEVGYAAPHSCMSEADWLLDVVTGAVQPAPVVVDESDVSSAPEGSGGGVVEVGGVGVQVDDSVQAAAACAAEEEWRSVSTMHAPVDFASLWRVRGHALLASLIGMSRGMDLQARGRPQRHRERERRENADGASVAGISAGGSCASFDALVSRRDRVTPGNDVALRSGEGDSAATQEAHASTGNQMGIKVGIDREMNSGVRGEGRGDSSMGGAMRPLSLFLQQFAASVHRTTLVRMREGRALALHVIVHVLMSAVLASGFSIYLQGSHSITYSPPLHPDLAGFIPPIVAHRAGENGWDVPLQQMMFFLPMMAGGAAALSSVGLFGSRVVLLKREAAAGASTFAWGCGAMVAELPLLIWGSLVFTGVWVVFAPPGPWWWWLGVMAGTAFAASGMAYAVSLLTRPTNAAVILTLLLTVSCVLAGVEPHLADIRRLGPHGSSVGLEILWYLSFATWTGEGAYACWSEHIARSAGPEQSAQWEAARHRVQTGADVFGYIVADPVRAIAALAGLGILWRLVALIILSWLVSQDSSRVRVKGPQNKPKDVCPHSRGRNDSSGSEDSSVQAGEALRDKIRSLSKPVPVPAVEVELAVAFPPQAREAGGDHESIEQVPVEAAVYQ